MRPGLPAHLGRARRLPSQLALPLGEDDPARRLDEGEVGERLREVAQVEPAADLELLGVEPERRGDPQQPLEQVCGRGPPPPRSPGPTRARTSR